MMMTGSLQGVSHQVQLGREGALDQIVSRLCNLQDVDEGILEVDMMIACREKPQLFEWRDENGNGILFHAARRNFMSLIRSCFRHFPLMKREEVINALKEALVHDRLSAADVIYEECPSLFSWEDGNEDTLLLWACRGCNDPENRDTFLSIVRWCLRKMSIETFKEQKHPRTGETPFFIACNSACLELVQCLHCKCLSARMIRQITFEEVLGRTPLLSALQHPEGVQTAQWLLTKGNMCICRMEELQALVTMVPRLQDFSLLGLFRRSTDTRDFFIPYATVIGRVLDPEEEIDLCQLRESYLRRIQGWCSVSETQKNWEKS